MQCLHNNWNTCCNGDGWKLWHTYGRIDQVIEFTVSQLRAITIPVDDYLTGHWFHIDIEFGKLGREIEN
jgi:hypothetical protein